MPKLYKRLQLADIAKLPKELLEVRQWVCWKLVQRESKLTKVPVSPKNGRNVSVHDLGSFGSAIEAIQYFSQNPGIQGIGFVFTKNDPYVGIDIDDCRNMVTGDIFDFARDILEKINSYAEESPSGTGIHIIAKGTIAGKLKRRNRIEIYSSERFFTITACPLPRVNNPADYYELIRECNKELAQLYESIFGKEEEAPDPSSTPMADRKLLVVQSIPDEKLLETAFEGRNGEPFKKLWEGNASDYEDDLSRATAALLMHLAYWTRGDEARIDKLIRQSGLMRKKWTDRRGDTTWGWQEIGNAIAKQRQFYDPELKDMKLLNDTSNCELFSSIYKGQFAWVEKWGFWISWNEICWEEDATLEAYEATGTIQKELTTRLSSAELAEKGTLSFIKQTGESWRRSAIEKWSRPTLAIDYNKFNVDPMLLACANGVIDLRKGKLRAGRREDYITKHISVEYNSEAKCPRFEQFLSEIMLGDKEMVKYLWRVIGYSLTGSVSERTFFLLCGSGRNGKSTLMTVLKALLGQYTKTAAFTTFIKTKFQTNAPRDDVAQLVGSRLVVAQEADEEMVLDASLIKALTGGDAFQARFLYGRGFEYVPTFKLFLVTNHVPKIRESAHALWDRLHYIPFDYRVEENHIDGQLPMKLIGELEGILAKAVESAQDWYENGLLPPAKVLGAKEELQKRNDEFAESFSEIVVFSPNARAKHKDIHAAYKLWCTANNYTPRSTHAMGKHLRGLGMLREFVGAGNIKWWEGIGLKEENR